MIGSTFDFILDFILCVVPKFFQDSIRCGQPKSSLVEFRFAQVGNVVDRQLSLTTDR